MKEVIAIIRRHNLQDTKAGLLGIGVPALTMVSVEGRGKLKKTADDAPRVENPQGFGVMNADINNELVRTPYELDHIEFVLSLLSSLLIIVDLCALCVLCGDDKIKPR